MTQSISTTKTYAQLSCYFKRKKIPNQRRLAYMLLAKINQSITPTGWHKITKQDDLMPNGILKKDDSLNEWRVSMEKNGILICKISPEERDLMDSSVSNPEAAYYKYGPAIEKYILDFISPSLINRIDNHTNVLDRHTKEIAELKAQIKSQNERLDNIDKLLKPPYTKEKIKKARHLAVVKQ